MGEKMKRIDLTELNIPQLSALKQQIDQVIIIMLFVRICLYSLSNFMLFNDLIW